MPVNFAQYRMTAEISNNRKIIRNLKFEEFPISKWLNNLFKYFKICSSLLFYICLCFLFLHRESVWKITAIFCILIFLLFTVFQIVFAWFDSLLVMLIGDVEVDPGHKKKDKGCLSICHWNLNSISAYGYSKLFLLNSFNFLHNLILYASTEHILILILLLMMTIWKSLVTHLFVLIIHLIPNVEVFVFTTKAIYL